MIEDHSGTARSRLLTLGIVALPVTYVLTVYLDQGVWITAAARAASVTALLAVVIIGIAAVILRDRRRGALVGACVIAILSFWHPALALLFALIAIVIVADSLLANRTGRTRPRDVELLHGALGVFGLLLLFVTVLQFGLRGQIAWVSPAVSANAPQTDTAPDIWVVLVDGYPRADVLSREWSYDNGPFVNGLDSLGFFVADRSRSNYNATKMTLASMFNMSLLRDIEPYSQYAKPADAPAADRVRALLHNRAFDILRAHGYRITTVAGGYTHEELRTADEYIDAGTADVVELYLVGRSGLGELLLAFMPEWGERQIRERIEANLATMDRLAADAAGHPRFVYLHIPGPHPPLVYRQMERRYLAYDRIFEYPVELYGDDLMHEAYRQNIAHLNRIVLDSLTRLVHTVGHESVVILMSDHGSRTSGILQPLSPDDVEEQFPSLFAARTPDGSELFDDEIMTANVLSTVFNRYLGTGIAPAPSIIETLDGTRYEG